MAHTPLLTLACPANVSTQADPGQSTISVTYPAPTVMGGKNPVNTTCNPASGSSFGIGNTVVACSAVDAMTQTAACEFSVAIAPPPARIGATTFMAFGDSLTEGKVTFTGAPGLNFPPSYPNKLFAMLQARYILQTIVIIARGEGGHRAADDVGRFDQALAEDKPQAVLLMEGANDLADSQDAGVDPAVAALGTMASHAVAKGATVFLATLPPEGPRAPGAVSVSSLNAKIVNLANARQLVLVDVNAAFHGDLSLIGADGLHATDAGYQVIAQTFFDRIVAKLELPPVSLFVSAR